MPTENRSSNTEMVSVPRDLAEEINSALYDHDLKGLTVRLQELLDKPELHQGDPVTLPACIAKLGMSHDWDQGYADGWKGCLEEAAKLGPLFIRPAPAARHGEAVLWRYRKTPAKNWFYTEHKRSAEIALCDGYIVEEFYAHADAGEVERLRAEVKRLDLLVAQADYNYDEDRANFKRQLAERDALLREQSGKLIVLAARLLQEPLRALNGDLDNDGPITRVKVTDGVERAGDSLGGLALEVRRAADALSACAGPTCPICRGTLRVKEPGQDEGDCARCIEAPRKS